MSVQLRGGRRGSIAGYPHQWFDLSSTYLPPSVKELFRWCAFLYASHSEIAPVIDKTCAYAITGLTYDTDKEKPRALWVELLEKVLRIREMEFKYLLDFRVYGNAYASILFPFERYLHCPSCSAVQVARRSSWVYQDHHFLSKCTQCGRRGEMTAKDKPIRNRSRVKLIRWNPQYIDIKHNPVSDEREYIYRIPKWLRQRIGNVRINKMYVETTPLEFLTAIRDQKNLGLDSSNIYHFRNPGPSGEDDAYGMPPMMSIFKDAWLFQAYRRAQEAIALEHALPLTILVPQPTANGVSPHLNTDLSEWSRKTMEIVHKWRRDQNSIYTAPFPMTVENIRGDAKALNVFEEMNMVRQQIAGGLGVPQEFVWSGGGQGLSWSGSSISLRVLENTFLGIVAALDSFLQDFLVPKLGRYFALQNVKIKHRDFKMADDAQQKQIALSLRQTNTVSDRTVLEELGFDSSEEARRKLEEAKERDQAMIEQMTAQAEAQGKALQKQTEYQLKAQQLISSDQTSMRNTAMNGIPAAPRQTKTAAIMSPVDAAAQALPSFKMQPTPRLLDVMVDRFLKGPGDSDAKRLELLTIQHDNPALARAIKERMRVIRRQSTDKFMRPLPEQKPPRRTNSPV